MSNVIAKAQALLTPLALSTEERLAKLESLFEQAALPTGPHMAANPKEFGQIADYLV